MSNFTELYEQLTDKEKQQFSDTVNLMLGKTHLVYEREEDRRHYRFVEKNLELFTAYLEMARWSLHLQKQYGVIQLYNMEERNRYNFNLQETIFLVILRLLYDEKRRDLQLTRQVLVTAREVQEKYMALQIRRRLPSREDTQRILRLLSSFSLLDLKKGHWRDPDAVYLLYPSLMLVVHPGDLDSLVEWLREQGEQEDSDAEDRDLFIDDLADLDGDTENSSNLVNFEPEANDADFN